jgi:hypothetical protein
MSLPWYYLSQHDRIALIDGILYYSDGLIAGNIEGKKTIKKGDYVLVENDNVFVEAKWKEKEIIAFSKDGYSNKTWVMPQSWKGVKSIDTYRITLTGPEQIESGKKIENGQLVLTLGKDEAISVVPNGFNINQYSKQK